MTLTNNKFYTRNQNTSANVYMVYNSGTSKKVLIDAAGANVHNGDGQKDCKYLPGSNLPLISNIPLNEPGNFNL